MKAPGALLLISRLSRISTAMALPRPAGPAHPDHHTRPTHQTLPAPLLRTARPCSSAGPLLTLLLFCCLVLLCIPAQAAQAQTARNTTTQPHTAQARTALAQAQASPANQTLPDEPGPPDAESEAAGPKLSGHTALYMEKVPPRQRYLLSYMQRIMEKHDPEAAFGKGQVDLPAQHLAQWRNLALRMPKLDHMQQLRYINGFFNNFPSRSDQDLYGRADYWATPEEFMAKRAGDCEDYALTKYLALRHFGWPARDMWLLLVRKRKSLEHHAVLAARHDGHIFILDNLSRPAYQLVPEKIFMTGFIPLFAINEEYFWYFAGTEEKNCGKDTDSEAGFAGNGNNKDDAEPGIR